jgi:hypothetical protein
MLALVPAFGAQEHIEEAPTGPRETRPDDKLRAISNHAFPSWPGIAVRRTASLPLAYVPAIHVFSYCRYHKTWLSGTSPGMTGAAVRPREDAANRGGTSILRDGDL